MGTAPSCTGYLSDASKALIDATTDASDASVSCANEGTKCTDLIAAAQKLIARSQSQMNKTSIDCDLNNADRSKCSKDLAASLKSVNAAGMDITIASEGGCNALSNLFLH